jgi:hypothetical protein
MPAPLAQPDYEALFRDYVAAYNRSLGDTVDVKAFRAFFAESFIGAGANGQVSVGRNDESFAKTLQQGYAFYKAIGTRRMEIDLVHAEPLHEGHDKVIVSYRAHYKKKDGSRLEIPFQLVYLLQRREGGPKIFGFVAGDEMALYREHGLVDEQGRPAS